MLFWLSGNLHWHAIMVHSHLPFITRLLSRLRLRIIWDQKYGNRDLNPLFKRNLQDVVKLNHLIFCVLMNSGWSIFTERKRSCGQGYVFTRVCDSVHKGGSASLHAGYHPPEGGTPPGRRSPRKETPTHQGRRYPPRRRPLLGRRHPRGRRHPQKEAPPWEGGTPRKETPGKEAYGQ